MKKLIPLTFIIILFLNLTNFGDSYSFYAEVSRVIDGDTIQVNNLRLRLNYIDAPEKEQKSFDGKLIGLMSTDYLKKIVANKKIRIEVVKKDIYGRYLANLFIGEKSISLDLLRNGHALLYPFNKYKSVGQKIKFQQVASLAKIKRKGMWSSGGFLSPYHYRKKMRK